MVSLFLMSRGVRLLESVIPEQFVSKTRTQVQSIGSAMLIPLLIHADDKSLSHKSLNSWPVQYLGKMGVLATPSPWPAVAVGLVYDATLCMGSDGVRDFLQDSSGWEKLHTLWECVSAGCWF
jgi:hypothetical protein